MKKNLTAHTADDAFEKFIASLKKSLKKECPTGYVPRAALTRLTGGLINSRTAANRDCLGCGIAGRVVIGKRNFYPVDAVVESVRVLGSNKKAPG